jgi:hypothetical protein
MAPSQIRDQTLTSLREARKALMSFEWLTALEDQPPAKKRESALALFQVQEVLLRLGNTELAEIRDKLKENENELEQGGNDLKRALENLQNVEKVLEAVNSVLNVVVRIIALLV